MLCRVEILKAKRVICAHYKTGEAQDIDAYAWQECRTRRGDGYRINNLHTNEVTDKAYERL